MKSSERQWHDSNCAFNSLYILNRVHAKKSSFFTIHFYECFQCDFLHYSRTLCSKRIYFNDCNHCCVKKFYVCVHFWHVLYIANIMLVITGKRLKETFFDKANNASQHYSNFAKDRFSGIYLTPIMSGAHRKKCRLFTSQLTYRWN